MQADRSAGSGSDLDGQEGAQRSCVCCAGSLALRRRLAGHTAPAIEGDRGAGEILRGNRCAGIKETGVPGLARSCQGPQDNKEGCALGGASDSQLYCAAQDIFLAADPLYFAALQSVAVFSFERLARRPSFNAPNIVVAESP